MYSRWDSFITRCFIYNVLRGFVLKDLYSLLQGEKHWTKGSDTVYPTGSDTAGYYINLNIVLQDNITAAVSRQNELRDDTFQIVFHQTWCMKHCVFKKKPVMWVRIRIHLCPWIRIQRYKIADKMKGKAKFNQQKYFFFRRKLYFSSLNLKKK